MQFVNPGILYGLLAVSIPVIIHLFNFRRFRKVYFTNVAFIKELKQETQKQSRLKHLLVLLMRMLAVASIVIAFARPYIPVGNSVLQQQETNSISIYIDNSFSMQAESEKGTMLDAAREKALEIAGVYKSSDRFQLLTNDFEGRHQRFVSKEEFIDLVEDIGASPVVKNLQEVIMRQEDLLMPEPAKVKSAFLISDFQQGFLSEFQGLPDSAMNFFLLPLKTMNADNLYIDSCWFQSPVQQENQNVNLHARIINSSANSYEKLPVKLSINGAQRALASFDVGPGESIVVDLPFTNTQTGIHQGIIEISDFPINFDDQFYFSYSVRSVINVLCINGNEENVFLKSLFYNDSLINFQNVNEGMLNYSTLTENDLVILNELVSVSSGLTNEIKQFVENGGSLMVLPSMRSELENYNEFLGGLNAGRLLEYDSAANPISWINTEHPLFEDVFESLPENIGFPEIQRYFPIEAPNRSLDENLLLLQNNNIFLKVNPYAQGKVFLFASPFDLKFSKFPQHGLFVPTVYKIALSGNSDEKLFYTIGDENRIQVNRVKLYSEEVLKVTREDNFEIIPEIRRVGNSVDLFMHDQISHAGNYLLEEKDGKPVKGLSFNYSRVESEMFFSAVAAIEKYIADNSLTNVGLINPGDKPVQNTLMELSHGIRLWRWFVLAALVFLLMEVILLRFFKR
jgi:hypothetical protein